MLSPELIRKIRGIHVRTGRLVNTLLAGQYHSAFKGAGIEFEEVREYAAGDEIRSIDWNVTARMGRPFVKLYREERELVILLLVDLSGSGAFGTADKLKREAAAELGAILAFNAIRNNDRVGAVLFTDRVERYIPPKRGAAHVWRVIQAVLSHEAESPRTDIAEALRFIGRVMKRRCVAFLISDFHGEGYESAMALAGRRHDLIGVRVTDPGDDALPAAGLVALADPETGERMTIDASHRSSREAYAAHVRAQRAGTDETLGRLGVDLIDVSTAGDPVEPVRRFFEKRERRRAR